MIQKTFFPFVYNIESNLESALDYIDDYAHPIQQDFDDALFECATSIRHQHFDEKKFKEYLQQLAGTVLSEQAEPIHTFRDADYLKAITEKGFLLKSSPKLDHTYEKSGSLLKIITSPQAVDPWKYCLRAIRELHLRNSELSGATLLHAASIEVAPGEAWLLVGEKGAGKSSLLLWLLLSDPQFRMLSNDRSFIWAPGSLRFDSHWWTTYFPMAALIGPGLLQAALGENWLQQSSLITRKQENRIEKIAELVAKEGASSHFSKKILMSSRDISTLFKKETSATARIKGIVFPDLRTSTDGGIQVKKLPVAEAVARLKRQCYTPNDPAYGSGWLVDNSEKRDALGLKAQEQLSKLAVEVKSVQVSFDYCPDKSQLREQLQKALQKKLSSKK